VAKRKYYCLILFQHLINFNVILACSCQCILRSHET